VSASNAAGRREVFLPDEAATVRLGGEMAALLQPGDLLLLEGDLGAGKTSLARAILRAIAGDAELEVPSPSFSLVQHYAFAGTTVLHADLYRLGDPREIEELGLLDNSDAIVLVEWAERAPELRLHAAFIVSLAVPPSGIGRLAIIETAASRR
jgi:tRNA threonylcarbamoyladenosine biosynthesis protein TsaE